MNKALLRSIMVLHGDKNKDLADYLGISEQILSKKINENGTEFKQGEIKRIKARYNLSADQVDHIFLLSECLHQTPTKERRTSWQRKLA